jgi:putative sporulation protein YyaC
MMTRHIDLISVLLASIKLSLLPYTITLPFGSLGGMFVKFSLPFQKNNTEKQESMQIKINHTEPNAKQRISKSLHYYLSRIPSGRDIVVVCIGTDRSTGDALGPLVGSHLHKRNLSKLHVYGTLDEPVHAMNLNETMEAIHAKHFDPFIIAIDACLGQVTSVGCIQVGEGPVKPGAGVNKELPEIGHMHITGIVNVGGFMEYFVLQNTRLSLVMNLSETIAGSINGTVALLNHFSAPTPIVKLD